MGSRLFLIFCLLALVIDGGRPIPQKKYHALNQSEYVRRGFPYLRQLHNRHRGQRCWVLGNGPSLNRMEADLPQLRNEVVFAANKIHLGLDRFGFVPSYLVIINDIVIEQLLTKLPQLPAREAVLVSDLSERIRPRLDQLVGRRLQLLWLRKRNYCFSSNPVAQPLCTGWTVTYANLQLAFYAGCQRVILVGVDHHFEQSNTPNAVEMLSGADPNHFDPAYFGNQTWNLADLVHSEHHYAIARHKFESHGRLILDATDRGKLNVFPKTEFRDALAMLTGPILFETEVIGIKRATVAFVGWTSQRPAHQRSLFDLLTGPPPPLDNIDAMLRIVVLVDCNRDLRQLDEFVKTTATENQIRMTVQAWCVSSKVLQSGQATLMAAIHSVIAYERHNLLRFFRDTDRFSFASTPVLFDFESAKKLRYDDCVVGADNIFAVFKLPDQILNKNNKQVCS